MKTQFRETFSKPAKVKYWDSVYDQQDFYADCLRLRMNKAMLWLDDLHLDGGAGVLDARLRAGSISKDEAIRLLGAPCTCGIFNPSRAREILTEMISRA